MTDTGAVSASPRSRQILVISTAGPGRFVQALGAMGAIRANHGGDTITILTTSVTADFAATSPYFDTVWIDTTLTERGLGPWRALRQHFHTVAFDRIYDLDGSAHSRHLFWLMFGWRGLRRGSLPWCGTMTGTPLAYEDSRRDAMHVHDRWAAQLRRADIASILRSDLSWVARRVTAFNVPFRMTDPFVLLAVDAGPGAPWPAAALGDLADSISCDGRVPVLVGFAPPEGYVAAILERCPAAVDLTGKATINELVFLAWAAAGAVGADNGIMHLTATAGCRAIVLFDNQSDPALVGQRGPLVTILRRPRLSDIASGEVAAALRRAV